MTNELLKNTLLFFKQNIVNLNAPDTYEKIDAFFDRTDFLKNIEYLESNSLIEENNRDSIYSLTEKGNNVLKQVTEKLEYEAEKEVINFENSKIDLKLKKWQLKTFWWIFGFGIFGGLYSGYDFIKNLTKKENIKEEKVTKAEMESELSKLRTLVLTQKKDSVLVHSNSEKDK